MFMVVTEDEDLNDRPRYHAGRTTSCSSVRPLMNEGSNSEQKWGSARPSVSFPLSCAAHTGRLLKVLCARLVARGSDDLIAG